MSSFSQRIEEKREKCYNIDTFREVSQFRIPLAFSSGDRILILKTKRDCSPITKVDQKLTCEKRWFRLPSQYTKLTYMSFEKTLKPFCKGVIEVENAKGIIVRKNITAQYLDSQILLVSGLDADEVMLFEKGDGIRSTGIGKDSLSVFRNGGSISPWIIAAYAGKDRDELVAMVSRHFEAELLPFLQGRKSQDAKRAIYDVIKADKEIPPNELAVLRKAYSDDSVQMFLAKSFVFAMIRETLTDGEERINAMVEQVLSDIRASGRSTLLNGLIDSIYECAVEGVTEFDTMPYYQEDIIKFVLGVLPVAEKLDQKRKDKFIAIRMRALEYEMNGEFKAGVSSACNSLFKKYGIGNKDFEVSRISWSDDANTLDLQFKNKIQSPVFAYKAADLAKAKTPEEFAKALGIKVEDFEKYGFDINDPIFRRD